MCEALKGRTRISRRLYSVPDDRPCPKAMSSRLTRGAPSLFGHDRVEPKSGKIIGQLPQPDFDLLRQFQTATGVLAVELLIG